MTEFGQMPNQGSSESWFAGELTLEQFNSMHKNGWAKFSSPLKEPKEVKLKDGTTKTVTRITSLYEYIRENGEIVRDENGKPKAGMRIGKVSWTYDATKPSMIAIRCYFATDKETGEFLVNPETGLPLIKTVYTLCNIGESDTAYEGEVER